MGVAHHLWPGIDVNVKVRLCKIDAPELHARCADEHDKAEAARAALQTILAAGDATISRVGLDKYGGRVDALVSTLDTADVPTALVNGGWARSYDGGRRGT
jgi:endonuclease YncB( thermonuclease family)